MCADHADACVIRERVRVRVRVQIGISVRMPPMRMKMYVGMARVTDARTHSAVHNMRMRCGLRDFGRLSRLVPSSLLLLLHPTPGIAFHLTMLLRLVPLVAVECSRRCDYRAEYRSRSRLRKLREVIQEALACLLGR